MKKQGKRSRKKHLSKEAIRKIAHKQMLWSVYKHTENYKEALNPATTEIRKSERTFILHIQGVFSLPGRGCNIRTKYGQECVKDVRKLEDLTRKVSRHRNHLVFTLRCKDINVTPPSLSLKCPINTTNARRIVDKARKDLVRERIRVINNKLDAFKEKKITLETKLFTLLSREEQQNVTRHIAHVSETTHEKTKWRHQNKIQRLETKRDRINDADLTGTQLKRWVINLSKYKLSGNQNKILAKGLNYAVTPEKVPTDEFVVAAEQAT